MPNWPPLNPVRQQETLDDITRDVIETLPEGWIRLIVHIKKLGRHSELDSGVKMSDGTVRRWSIPTEIWNKFQDLRGGMYTPGAGTWVEVEYFLDQPGRYSVRYNSDRHPQFKTPPRQEDYAADIAEFPRSEENIPEWLQRGLQSTE